MQNTVIKQDGDIAYSLKEDKTIKKLYVNQAMHNDLTKGRLAIADLDSIYELIPEPMTLEISER